jgi:hydroxymethylpyrimidine pyrophosphatase-like HAD family hydrolase
VQVLPLGSSKATGVQLLLDKMGVSPEDCMAIGDGEAGKMWGGHSFTGVMEL